MTLPLEEEQNKTRFAEWLFKQQCEFIAGAAVKEQLPPPSLPEYAFVGRSNVGKSSLLNSLVHRRQLARVSHTPGRTQQINFFTLGKRVLLVDLPGYGYSQVGRQRVKEWGKVIQWYLSNRPTLKRVFLLIDSRHPLKQLDQEAMTYLDSQALSFQVVLTKTDKGKVDPALLEEIKKNQGLFKNFHPTLLLVSAKQKIGIDNLRHSIADFLITA